MVDLYHIISIAVSVDGCFFSNFGMRMTCEWDLAKGQVLEHRTSRVFISRSSCSYDRDLGGVMASWITLKVSTINGDIMMAIMLGIHSDLTDSFGAHNANHIFFRIEYRI